MSRRLAAWTAVFFNLSCILFWPQQAFAHVKWFAPYLVGAAPQPIYNTFVNSWFWTGIALVLLFFLATVLVERSKTGDVITRGLNQATGPLWNRADDFTRAIIGAFFVAIFAVGGVYLTPDLKTPTEWVSWLQLLIGVGVFSRHTMKFSSIGIILLWLIALRDYEIFHLLDYLALGLGVAGYLWLASSGNPTWQEKRFYVLRWGVAIALMWSSLEKFAYPDWFYPLVEEKPFLTFGMPRDVFIPMAGVAEFTMGFGLLWTPLIRRLSAVALFIIFNAAVYPFGRIDLVGHALIMCTLIVIMVDPTRFEKINISSHRALLKVPVMLLVSFVVIGGTYWGLHRIIYGAAGQIRPAGELLTHTPNAEHPHGHDIESRRDNSDPFAAVNAKMHREMIVPPTGNTDIDYMRQMIPHHQGAVDMSEILLKHGKDPETRGLAKNIIENQKYEIEVMKEWLARHPIESGEAAPPPSQLQHHH